MPFGRRTKLVITETLDSVAYETWIYWRDGQLRESLILKGDPAIEASSLIAEIDGFHPSIDQSNGTPGKVKIHVWRNCQGKGRDLTLNLSLRASQCRWSVMSFVQLAVKE